MISDKTKAEMQAGLGVKDDTGKSPLSLIPYEALHDIGLALDFGRKKYDTYNFTNGLSWMRMLDAAGRHLFRYVWVERIDSESGLSHLAHAGACIVMLIWHEKNRPDLDDTYVAYREKMNESK